MVVGKKIHVSNDQSILFVNFLSLLSEIDFQREDEKRSDAFAFFTWV